MRPVIHAEFTLTADPASPTGEPYEATKRVEIAGDDLADAVAIAEQEREEMLARMKIGGAVNPSVTLNIVPMRYRMDAEIRTETTTWGGDPLRTVTAVTAVGATRSECLNILTMRTAHRRQVVQFETGRANVTADYTILGEMWYEKRETHG